MTKAYEYQATLIVAVEADGPEEARRLAEEIAEEMNAERPVGVRFIHRLGHVELIASK